MNTVEKQYFENNFVMFIKLFMKMVNKLVPLDEANTDYQAIQEWIADGGTVIDNGGGE